MLILYFLFRGYIVKNISMDSIICPNKYNYSDNYMLEKI